MSRLWGNPMLGNPPAPRMSPMQMLRAKVTSITFCLEVAESRGEVARVDRLTEELDKVYRKIEILES